MTNAIPLIQLAVNHAGYPSSLGGYEGQATVSMIQSAAQHAGYNISGADIAMALTLTGTIAAGVTHLAHLAMNGWRRVGGLDGLKAFLKTGK